MKARRSPKGVIESVEDPSLEENWFKFSGEEPKANSKRRGAKSLSVNLPEQKARTYARHLEGYKEARGTGIHTHPYKPSIFGGAYAKRADQFPSTQDLKYLMSNPYTKTEVIAQTDAKTGEVLNYTVLRKTKKTPVSRFTLDSDLSKPLRRFLLDYGIYKPNAQKIREEDLSLLEYENSVGKSGLFNNLGYLEGGLKKFAEKNHLQYRFVPVKHSSLAPQKYSGLESTAITASILSLIGSVFFLSSNMTGNIIGSLSTKTISLIGVCLFIIAILTGFFWLKNKR